jgi:hypothetical protein
MSKPVAWLHSKVDRHTGPSVEQSRTSEDSCSEEVYSSSTNAPVPALPRRLMQRHIVVCRGPYRSCNSRSVWNISLSMVFSKERKETIGPNGFGDLVTDEDMSYSDPFLIFTATEVLGIWFCWRSSSISAARLPMRRYRSMHRLK